MQLIETIRTCNRYLENISYHNARFNRSRKELFGINDDIDLREAISIPPSLSRKLHKCRVLYDHKIRQVEFIPYRPKTIKNFELVQADDLEYTHKYADRSQLTKLLSKSAADEIIIVKKGLVTDCSFANLCFFDGKKWWTPATPLLPGTKRAKLLAEGRIHPADIRLTELCLFKKIKLINALFSSLQSISPQSAVWLESKREV